MSFTELVIKRPTLVVVMFAVFGALGLFGYSQLKYELLPKFSVPVITVATVYPGASPSEVETEITKRIEDAVSSIDKISSVNSTSREGVSFVAVEFVQDAKIDIALQDVQRKVNEIISLLPDEAKTPVLSKIAIDEFPIIRMGMTSTMPSRDFYQFIKDRVQPRLSKLAGVGNIVLIGGDEREVRINIDAEKLRGYGLSIIQVTQAVKSGNLDFPTGKIKDTDRQFIVRIAGKLESIDALRNLSVGRSKQGGDIRLSDVAEVEDGRKEYVNISRINGKTSVGVFIQKQSDANAVSVAQTVRKELMQMEKDYSAQDVRFDIAQDGSLFTVDAADAVKTDLAFAIALVALVMLVFLHSLRNSLIVMIAIPCSLISTFGVMYALGFSLNLMTLLGLSLAVGIWVDDSIVVLENIYRRLEAGDDSVTAAVRGRSEIGFTALSITLVDVVVFLPLSIVGGLIGNIMREFALVIVVSTLFSLLVSFTVTPVLAAMFSKVEHLSKGSIFGRFGLWFEEQFSRFTAWYISLLKWSLEHRGRVGLAVLGLFVGLFLIMGGGFVGGEFITQSDRGEFSVALELQPGTSIEQTNFKTQQVEQILAEIPEVEKVFTNVGASTDGFIGQNSSNLTELNVALKHKEERTKSTDDVIIDVKKRLQVIPGAQVRVNPIGLFGGANQTPIQVVVSNTSAAEAQAQARKVRDMLGTIPGTTDIRLSSEDGNPETRVEIDRQKMATFGLSLAEVGTALRVALDGDNDAKFRDGDTEYDIRILLDEHDRAHTANIAGMVFTNSKGQQVELQQFAKVYRTSGPTKLQRFNRIPSVTVFSQVNGRPSGTIGNEFKAALAASPLSSGTEISYIGDLKNQSEGFGSLGIALLAAILFMYLIMVALYDSYLSPFIVLFSLPLAIIGAILALALTAKTLNIFSILGMIMLMGLVAKNAILLVDFANKAKEDGFSTKDAVLESGKERLRPILMTTLTMILGMLPIALSHSSGSEWKTALGWVLIGGLTSSMFLTLVVVPVVYSKMDELRDSVPAFFGKLFGAKRKEVAVQPISTAQFEGK